MLLKQASTEITACDVEDTGACDGWTAILWAIVNEQNYQVHKFRNYLVSIAPKNLAIGSYKPVSNVHEHSQISLDVAALTSKLQGDNPDYSAAKISYESGVGNSCKTATQPRTLQGFAQKDLEGETFADAFYASGLAKNFWDTWVQDALAGTGDFAGVSRVKRVTSLKKGMAGLVTFYASHELEAGIKKGADSSKRGDDGSAHAWDEGWAFYYGVDGASAPWEVSKKMDAKFPAGTQVQTAITPFFNKGLIAVRTESYSDADAKEARDTIYKMWAVTYLRAALMYLEISERSYDETAHAEGYAYYKAIDGWVHSKAKAAAVTMRNALKISQTSVPVGTYCAAKAAVEAGYPAMGIDCAMVGTLVDSTVSVTTCSLACTAASVTLPAGADAVNVVVDAAVDVACTPAITTAAPTAPPLGASASEVLHFRLALVIAALSAVASAIRS